MPSKKAAIVLVGGGARAAYQVGVLKAIAAMLPPHSPNPFPIICGTSAGAINGAALAIYGTHFHGAVKRLVEVWEHFRTEQVLRTDAPGVFSNGARWLTALASGGLSGSNPRALLDRTPLRELLETRMPCERIQHSIDAGAVHAVSVTASGYTSGQSVTFYQGVNTIAPWKRARRVGCPAQIGIEHLLASSAIPFLFSAVKINREYFGDGSMRQIAPLSAALHLGAEKIFIIGARSADDTPLTREKTEEYPSLAQIAGHVLNSIFLDTVEADLERLQRVNRTIGLIQSRQMIEGGTALRHTDAMLVAPSKELDKMAMAHADLLPWPIAFLLRGLGGLKKNSGQLLSYLLFEREYCRELIQLGYDDTLARREEISEFLEINPAPGIRRRA